MPFALVFVGLLLIITGFQNTYREFGQQVQSDFTGPNNFLFWLAAILIVGSAGYIKGLEKFSHAFLALIMIALVLSIYKQNPAIFSNIGSGILSGSTSPVNPVGAPLAGGGGSGAGGGDGFSLSNIGSDVTLATDAAAFFGF